MLILSGHEIDQCLPMADAISGMKQAFAASSAGSAEMPNRSVIPVGDDSDLAIFMPAHIKDSSTVSVKSLTFLPDNESSGLPIIQAVVLIFDVSTGSPVALMDGSRLTAIRTAAGGGASVDLLARKDSTSLAMLGSGKQARAGIEAACAVRDINSIRLYSPTPGNAQKLADDLFEAKWCPEIDVVADPDEAVVDADIVWTATTSSTPTFSQASVAPGTHIVGIGSFQPSMIEIEPSILNLASIFIDQSEACWSEAGEIISARAQGLLNVDEVVEVGEIVLGLHPGRVDDEEITVFKSVGIAAQDAVASSIALDTAKSQGVGTTVSI
ncbi:MAG: ornithine cyclodeaminase family protein [Actinomycetota bacterium]|nr:ornithine cyclodeaminase family protein [Actinomycetota bacterium]